MAGRKFGTNKTDWSSSLELLIVAAQKITAKVSIEPRKANSEFLGVYYSEIDLSTMYASTIGWAMPTPRLD